MDFVTASRLTRVAQISFHGPLRYGALVGETWRARSIERWGFG